MGERERVSRKDKARNTSEDGRFAPASGRSSIDVGLSLHAQPFFSARCFGAFARPDRSHAARTPLRLPTAAQQSSALFRVPSYSSGLLDSVLPRRSRRLPLLWIARKRS